MTNPEETLKARAATHGDFKDTARVAQELKRAIGFGLTDGAGKDLPDAQREALDMICTKLARIVSGNPQEPDHWRDIAGYALLGERACAPTEAPCAKPTVEAPLSRLPDPSAVRVSQPTENVLKFDGPQGSGKSTALRYALKCLREAGCSVGVPSTAPVQGDLVPPAGTTVTYAPRTPDDKHPWTGEIHGVLTKEPFRGTREGVIAQLASMLR